MFSVNDTVMYGKYGNSGICKIVDIRKEKFGKEEMLYYILKPVYDDKSMIYCPVDSEKLKIRKLLTIDEVRELIKAMPDAETEWIENDQQRKESFNNILKNGTHLQLIKLIKTLHFKREEKENEGKRFHASDERIMKEAETIVYSEFAHVLKIKQNEVVPFIVGKINGEAADCG